MQEVYKAPSHHPPVIPLLVLAGIVPILQIIKPQAKVTQDNQVELGFHQTPVTLSPGSGCCGLSPTASRTSLRAIRCMIVWYGLEVLEGWRINLKKAKGSKETTWADIL